MPIKKYQIEIYTDQEFNRFDNDKAIEWLIENSNKIHTDNVTLLPDEIDWEAEAEAEAENIWNMENLEDKLEQAQEVETAELAGSSVQDMFAGDIQKSIDCLQYFGDQDEGIADTSSYQRFLQQRAGLAYQRAVKGELEKMIANYNS